MDAQEQIEAGISMLRWSRLVVLKDGRFMPVDESVFEEYHRSSVHSKLTRLLSYLRNGSKTILSSPDTLKASLAEVGYSKILDLLKTYSGRGRDLGPWAAGAEINTDKNLRLQYLAAVGLNNNLGTEIRDSMLRYRQFPMDLFAGQASSIESLRALMMEGSSAP